MLTRSVLATCVLFFISNASAEILEVGAAVVDITPQQWPLKTRGQFVPTPATRAHDPLNSRSIAFRNGDGQAVVTIVDNLYLSREVIDEIKQRAAASSGWAPDQMLIAGTHTHTAPSIAGTDGTPASLAYREHAMSGIAESIAGAISRLAPAKVGFGSGEEPSEVFNRRWYLKDGAMPPNPFGEIDAVKMNPSKRDLERPAGPTDPEVAVIDVRDAKSGKPLALLANYALHYVGAVPSGQLSADYFGEFCRLMPSRLGRGTPDDFVVALSNGTSGDINNIDFTGARPPRERFEQIHQVATKVADAAYRALDQMEYSAEAPVGIVQREISLKIRKPDEATLMRAREIIAMDDAEKKAADFPRLADHYAVRTLAAAERDETVEVIIQAIRIGDQAIVSLPFEVLVEIGLDLKKRSPFKHTMIIELANGGEGYLPPPNQHELGGYETWLGTNKVQKDASVILTDALLEMLKALK